MSSLGTVSRKTGRSRSPNPPLSRKRSPKRGGQDGFPSSDAAANTLHRAAPGTPVATASKPVVTTAKPAVAAAEPTRRRGGGPATMVASIRGRPPTRGAAGRPINTSRSLTPNQPPVSPPAQARSSPLGPQSDSRRTDQPDALPQVSPELTPPITAELDSAPRGTINNLPSVTASVLLGDQPVSVFGRLLL